MRRWENAVTDFSRKIPLARDSVPGQPRSWWDKQTLAKAKAESAQPEVAAQSVCPLVGPQNMGRITESDNATRRPGWQVMRALVSAGSAKTASGEKFFGMSPHNTQRDAYRHFLWNFKMARSMGPERASAFANSHEVSDNGPSNERRMDLHNNAVGRLMAMDPRFFELNSEEAGDIALRSGCLITKPGTL